jgi:hypothetical protein
MSVQTIYQSALYRFSVTPDNQRFADAYYSSLNAAQRDFCMARSWGFLRASTNLTTVADTRTVALPSDFGKLMDIPNSLVITAPAASAGGTVEFMPMAQWRSNFYEDGTDTGTPQYAYAMGSYMYLSPVPDAAYTVAMLYYKTPTEIAETSTALTVPSLYEEALKKMTFRRLQDEGFASIQELQISDADIDRLIGSAARDDMRKYGGMTFNLSDSAYTRRTV